MSEPVEYIWEPTFELKDHDGEVLPAGTVLQYRHKDGTLYRGVVPEHEAGERYTVDMVRVEEQG